MKNILFAIACYILAILFCLAISAKAEAAITIKEEKDLGIMKITKVCIDGYLWIILSSDKDKILEQVFVRKCIPATCIN